MFLSRSCFFCFVFVSLLLCCLTVQAEFRIKQSHENVTTANNTSRSHAWRSEEHDVIDKLLISQPRNPLPHGTAENEDKFGNETFSGHFDHANNTYPNNQADLRPDLSSTRPPIHEGGSPNISLPTWWTEKSTTAWRTYDSSKMTTEIKTKETDHPSLVTVESSSGYYPSSTAPGMTPITHASSTKSRENNVTVTESPRSSNNISGEVTNLNEPAVSNSDTPLRHGDRVTATVPQVINPNSTIQAKNGTEGSEDSIPDTNVEPENISEPFSKSSGKTDKQLPNTPLPTESSTKSKNVVDAEPIIPDGKDDPVPTAAGSSGCDFCVDIITLDGNMIFCNITKCWTPRFSKDVGLLITFFPVGISSLVSLYGLYLLIPGLNKEFMKSRPKFKGSKYFCRCFIRVLDYIWQFSVVVMNVYFLTIFTTLFDVFDVYMDFSMGYRMEIGGVIESHIYQNVWVINFIFAFAFLGVIKIAICLHILRDKSDRVTLFEAKSQCYCIGFLLEDCGEMFLEYFYIETYLTAAVGIPWFLIIRNIVYCFLSLRLLFWRLLELMKRCYSKESDSLGISFFGTSVIIGVASLTRTGSAIYQTFTGHIRPGCLDVVDGSLVQTPFNASCLTTVNYSVIVLTFLPLLLLPGALIYYTKKNDSQEIETPQKPAPSSEDNKSVTLGPTDYPMIQAELSKYPNYNLPPPPPALFLMQNQPNVGSQYALSSVSGQPQQYQLIPVRPMITSSSQVLQYPPPIYSEAYSVQPDVPIRPSFDLSSPSLPAMMPMQYAIPGSDLRNMLTLPKNYNRGQEMWNYAVDSVIRREVRKENGLSQKQRKEIRRQRSFSESLHDRVRLPQRRVDHSEESLGNGSGPLYEDLKFFQGNDSGQVNDALRGRFNSDPPGITPPTYGELDQRILCRSPGRRLSVLQSYSEPNLFDKNKVLMPLPRSYSNEQDEPQRRSSASEIRLSYLQEIEI